MSSRPPGTDPLRDGVLIAIPAYGATHLTDAVVADLLRDSPQLLPNSRIVVVDNRGDYVAPAADERLSIHRPAANLRWIGSVNWALEVAAEQGDSVCIVINNDTRLSADFAYRLASSFAECADVAVAAACYDDFWLHQRAHVIPDEAAHYEIAHAYRQVPFCDGTAIAFSVAAAGLLGPLDQQAFPNQGYGADIDYALRARDRGLRCVVTDAAYVQHLRRGTMQLIPEETGEFHRLEILTGLDAKWGPQWRARAGLSPDSFPAHNTGSAASWYL
jgi:GT2 family glycosyltransferase